LNVTGYDGFLPFAAGAMVFSAAALPLFIAPAPDVAPSSERTIFRPMKKDPVLFGASAMFAGVETAMLIFLPILALEVGHGAQVGAQSLTVYGIGLLLAQIPIGQAADRFPPRKVMALCAALGGGLALTVPAVQGSVLALFAVLFVWGGLVGGIYTAGLVALGNTFKGPTLTAANTGFVFSYASGGVIGALFAGIIRDLAGPNGMIGVIAVALALYALAAQRSRDAAAGEPV
jgi:MFS family permease